MASGDVKYWDTSYGKTLDQLDGFIATMESGSGDAREDAMSEASRSLKRLAGMRRSYNLEIKLIKDPNMKAHYNLEKSQKDSRYATLQSRFDAAKASGDSTRDELFGGRRDVESGEAQGKSAEAKLTEADQYQDKTEAAYKNMIGVLQETEATADNTAVELTNQREQLARITEDVTEIDSLLTRADRLVKVFSKRMMTDKFIQCFGCLNVSAMVAIIVYVVVQQVELPGGDDNDVPDPAAGS
ncbi:unnamed protein product [Ectocarpus sp. CCAP 1310/34]|nr:unnamed protein product [Ectocarpus sp. CCAP 1310/34]